MTLVVGPKVIVLGLEGSGKTDSLSTLIEAGLKVFVVFVEQGMEVLEGARIGRPRYSCAQGLHWHYIELATPEFSDLANAADLLNKFSYKALAGMEPSKRDKFRAHYETMATLANLKCDRCGQAFGPADKLPPYEWAVALDSLTSFSKAALYGHVGVKPGVHEGEYGICMRNIEMFLDKWTGSLPCMGIILGHIDKEPNEVTGGAENMIATLGKKLAPKVGRAFSDVILTKRTRDTFTWTTVEDNYKLKTRNLEFKDGLQPSFKPIVENWRRRIKAQEEQDKVQQAQGQDATAIKQ